MRYIYKLFIISLCVYAHSNVMAGPWFTGPLLAPSGHTIPRGHTNFEIYGVDVNTTGKYDNAGNLVHTPVFKSIVANPLLTHGFTDWMDVQLSLPYIYNSTQGVHYSRLTDVSAAIGLQLLEQKDSTWKPDLRFVIQEVLPTGKYQMLNPAFLGTDSTGLGSYQTLVGLNFQRLTEFSNGHYLRTRLNLQHIETGPVSIRGLSSYGGTTTTQGREFPGTENDIDLAFEYTITQNWVAVMEGYISSGKGSLFNGILSIGDLGGPDNIGSGDYYEEALAPAIEYNFNGNIGLIGGVWFPIKGKNTSEYMTYVLALNAYW